VSKIIIGKADGKSVGFDIPELLTTRLLVQANSGGGKSWLLRRMAEQLFGKVQTIIIDPEGEFFTLREKFGYVLVGEGGETPADVRSAALLAQKFMELKISAVCDLFEAFRSRPTERRRWVRDFLNALLEVPRSQWNPLIVIVDEAHKFCPQETPKAGDMKEREIIGGCKDAMIALSTTGRKRGFCAIWATQRLAKLDKDASAELFNRLVGMTIEDVDVDRAADLMSVSREDKQEFRTSLRTLDPGQFYAFGRAISKVRELVTIGEIETRHPESGKAARYSEPPPMPEAVAKLLPKLTDLPKEAEDKARSEAELKREIRELQVKLKAAEKAGQNAVIHTAHTLLSKPADHRAIERAVAAAVRPFREQLRAIKSHIARAGRSLPIVRGALEDVEKCLAEEVVPAAVLPEASVLTNETVSVHTVQRPLPSQSRTPRIPVERLNGDLSGPEQNILDQLAELEALGIAQPEKAQLSLMAGYTNSRSGGFSEPLGRLLQYGYASYPQPGLVKLTDDGRAHARPVDRPMSVSELHERLCQKLGGPEARLLREIIAIYPNQISKEELGARLGYTNVRSGGFSEPVGRLRSLGIIQYPERNAVRASDWLFLEAA
jgi:DNA helicase HerA-like ATPase